MESSCQSFGVDLLKTICKNDFNKNVIYSPMSIYMALGMTLYGAKGDTATEMMKTLHWDQSNSDSFHQQLSDCMKTSNVDDGDKGAIKIANKLFLENKYQLLDSYVKAVDKFYSGSIEKMDFQSNPEKSCKDINLWVEHQTNGKIKDLLQPNNINNLTRLILVNAIYFKGSWQNEFTNIDDQLFYFLDETSKSSKMMSSIDHYKYLKNNDIGFCAVQIPVNSIQNTKYSFMIVLPNDRYLLPQVEKSIFQQEWNSIFNNNSFLQSYVHIIMPKFRIESSFSLIEELKNLGMVDSFSSNADFSLISGKSELKIDNVVHKAFIDINEYGLEASAATAVMMTLDCIRIAPPNPVEIKCDHPFMFVLLKNTLPLFIGHFTKC